MTTISRASQSIQVAYKAHRPVILWGPPGVGKTQAGHQTAAALGLRSRAVSCSQLDPVDARGLPFVDPSTGAERWSRPAILPTPEDGPTLLILDELPNAAPSVQVALNDLLLEGSLGGHPLPDGCYVMATGNRAEDRAVGGRLNTATASRVIHLEVEPDLDEWVTWALAQAVDTRVIAFLRFRPALLHEFDARSASKTFPAPRTWEMASDILRAGAPPELELDLLAGTVGHGAASEFVGFLRTYRALPSLEQILLDPSGADIPTEPSALYAVAVGLAARLDGQTADAVVEYIERLPEEFGVLAVRDALRGPNAADVKTSAAFIGWATRHADVIL